MHGNNRAPQGFDGCLALRAAYVRYPSCGSSRSVLWARGGVRLIAGPLCGLEPGACLAGTEAARGVDLGPPCDRDANWTGSAKAEVPCRHHANAIRAAIFQAAVLSSPLPGPAVRRRAHLLR